MYKCDVRFEKAEEGNQQHQPQTSAAYFSITTVTITIVTTTTIITNLFICRRLTGDHSRAKWGDSMLQDVHCHLAQTSTYVASIIRETDTICSYINSIVLPIANKTSSTLQIWCNIRPCGETWWPHASPPHIITGHSSKNWLPFWSWLAATARTPAPFMNPADRRWYTLQHSCRMVQGSSSWPLWADATDLCCLRDLMVMVAITRSYCKDRACHHSWLTL